MPLMFAESSEAQNLLCVSFGYSALPIHLPAVRNDLNSEQVPYWLYCSLIMPWA